MSLIKKWNKLGLFTKIMVGFFIGIALGLILGKQAMKLAFLGTILTRLPWVPPVSPALAWSC